MVKTINLNKTKIVRSRSRVSKPTLEEMQTKLKQLNSEKLNLLLENEELRHELIILRRKFAHYFNKN